MKREAVYWDDADGELLTCTSPEEALTELFEKKMDYNEDVKIQDFLGEDVTITGFAPMEISQSEIESHASDAVERLDENLYETYGNPDRDSPLFPTSVRKALEAKFASAIQAAIKNASIWSCEAVDKKTFTAAEVEAILRDAAPEWFEEEK